MQYKSKSKPIVEIGRELNAGTILEGSVRKAGNRVRITIQMIDAIHDKHLWAESFDRELLDIFAIQSDVAERVAEALRIQLLSAEKKDIERRATESSEAFTQYLKGRYHWNERTREGNDKAVKYFEEAVKLDPKYALAYAGLADCYIIYGDYGWMEPKDAFPKAEQAISRAVELDPRLAEPHASLGVVYNSYEAEWDKAEKEFKQAIELKPSYATAHMWYGLLLMFLGRYDEAYDQLQSARELDPLSRVVGVNLGALLLYTGKTRDAIEQFETAIEANPDFPYIHTVLGFAYYLESRINEAISELRKGLVMSGGDPEPKADLACILGFAGFRDEADKLLEELKEHSRTVYISKVKIAQILFAFRRADEAFDYLDKAYAEKSLTADHGSTLLNLRVLPWFSEARKDPRWGALEKRLGLSGV
jgi:tetratricopeptide (TPR) repeat protein